MQAIKTLFKLTWLTLIVALVLFLGSQRAEAESVLYGAAHSPTGESVLYRIEPSTGVATKVGPIIDDLGNAFNGCSGMDFDSSWTLYATCERAGDGTHVLITIEVDTGIGKEVGPTEIDLIGTELQIGTDISFRSDGTLFAYVLGVRDYLGTVDLTSGLVSEVGKVNVFEFGNGLAFSRDNLFHAGSWSLFFPGSILRTLKQEPNDQMDIDIITAINLILPTQSPFFLNALEVEPRTGIMFASLNYGGSKSFLAIVNATNGQVTVIGQTQDYMDAIAFVPVITEAGPSVPLGPPYLKCNKVARGRYIRRHEEVEVFLENSSVAIKVRVLKPESLCTVLYDDGDVLTESTTNLACYRVKDVVRHRKNGHRLRFEWRHVEVTNEFGDHQTLSVVAHQTLCVPTEVTDDKVKIKTWDHKKSNY